MENTEKKKNLYSEINEETVKKKWLHKMKRNVLGGSFEDGKKCRLNHPKNEMYEIEEYI